MSHQYFKKMNAAIRATQREEARVQALIAEAREKSLKAEEEYILSAFADGQEEASFWYDAFALWGIGSSSASEIDAFCQRNGDLRTDPWCRAVWELSKPQALELGRLVLEWNHEWEHDITHNNEDYNAYKIYFCIASGEEHTISVSSGTSRNATANAWRSH